MTANFTAEATFYCDSNNYDYTKAKEHYLADLKEEQRMEKEAKNERRKSKTSKRKSKEWGSDFEENIFLRN